MGRIWKKKEDGSLEMGGQSNDGFNVRMNLGQDGMEDQQLDKSGIKISGVFTDKNTNEILYRVEQNGLSSYKSRKWVLSRDKMALILFYESLIKINNE